MNLVKGIYHNGVVEPIEKLEVKDPTEVIIIFPDSEKKTRKIGGLFKKHTLDYNVIKQDLKELSQKSEKHILEKDFHE